MQRTSMDKGPRRASVRPATAKRVLATAGVTAAVVAALQLTSPIHGVSAAVSQSAPGSQSGVQPAPGSVGFADAVQAVRPAVVNIASTTQAGALGPRHLPQFRFPEGSPFDKYFRDFFERGMPEVPRGMPGPEARAMGSGFIISADGLIVTNNHVVEHAEEITVTLHDGRKLPARVRGRDPKTDLALLEVDTGERLPYVEFGDSDAARVGDWVIAVGNPFGLGGTVTAGIISARGRDIRSGPYDDFLQIDAPINRGNSGGPLFDRHGEVIGINTAIFSPSGGNVGIGFAIPAKLAQSVVEELRENGRIDRGWIGVKIQPVTEAVAAGLGLDEAEGALVASVEPNGPASKSGLKAGDVILRFDDEPVKSMRDLPRMVADTEERTRVEMAIWRGGQRKTLELTVGRAPGVEQVATADSDTDGRPRLGISVAGLDEERQVPIGQGEARYGVVVQAVNPGGPAARQGLRAGDVIVMVGQKPIDTPDELVREVRRAVEEQREAVLLLVHRDGDERFVAVPFFKA